MWLGAAEEPAAPDDLSGTEAGLRAMAARLVARSAVYSSRVLTLLLNLKRPLSSPSVYFCTFANASKVFFDEVASCARTLAEVLA